MAKPTTKKKKPATHDPDADFFHGVTCRQMLEISRLATERCWTRMHQAGNTAFLFGVREEPPSPRNDLTAMQYVYTTLEKEDDMELRLYQDGFVGLYNWSNLLFKHNNARQVAALVNQYLQQ